MLSSSSTYSSIELQLCIALSCLPIKVEQDMAKRMARQLVKGLRNKGYSFVEQNHTGTIADGVGKLLHQKKAIEGSVRRHFDRVRIAREEALRSLDDVLGVVGETLGRKPDSKKLFDFMEGTGFYLKKQVTSPKQKSTFNNEAFSPKNCLHLGDEGSFRAFAAANTNDVTDIPARKNESLSEACASLVSARRGPGVQTEWNWRDTDVASSISSVLALPSIATPGTIIQENSVEVSLLPTEHEDFLEHDADIIGYKRLPSDDEEDNFDEKIQSNTSGSSQARPATRPLRVIFDSSDLGAVDDASTPLLSKNHNLWDKHGKGIRNFNYSDWDVEKGPTALDSDIEGLRQRRWINRLRTTCPSEESDSYELVDMHGRKCDYVARRLDPQTSNSSEASNVRLKTFLSHVQNKSPDEKRYRAFELARMGHTTQLEEMLDNDLVGFPVGARSTRRDTLLGVSAKGGHLETVRLLVRRGADLNEKGDGTSKCPPIIEAVKENHFQVVRELVFEGASIEATGDEDATALTVAAHNGNDAIVKFLCDRGADVEARDVDGYTPLIMAVKVGSYKCVEILLEYGASPNAKNNNDESPLYLCMKTESLRMDGIPLETEISDARESIAQLLLEKGADLNERITISGEKAHQYSLRKGRRRAERELASARNSYRCSKREVSLVEYAELKGYKKFAKKLDAFSAARADERMRRLLAEEEEEKRQAEVRKKEKRDGKVNSKVTTEVEAQKKKKNKKKKKLINPQPQEKSTSSPGMPSLLLGGGVGMSEECVESSAIPETTIRGRRGSTAEMKTQKPVSFDYREAEIDKSEELLAKRKARKRKSQPRLRQALRAEAKNVAVDIFDDIFTAAYNKACEIRNEKKREKREKRMQRRKQQAEMVCSEMVAEMIDEVIARLHRSGYRDAEKKATCLSLNGEDSSNDEFQTAKTDFKGGDRPCMSEKLKSNGDNCHDEMREEAEMDTTRRSNEEIDQFHEESVRFMDSEKEETRAFFVAHDDSSLVAKYDVYQSINPTLLHRLSLGDDKDNLDRFARSMHCGIMDFYSESRLDHFAKSYVQGHICRLEALIKRCFRTCSVCIFGSLSTGLSLKHSDVDMVIVFPRKERYIERDFSIDTLHILMQMIAEEDWVLGIRLIDTAAIPVLKMLSMGPQGAMQVDVSVAYGQGRSTDRDSHHMGLVARDYVREAVRKIDALGPLVLVVKEYLHRCGLNIAFRGGLSSHALFLMCHFFVLREMKPKETKIFQPTICPSPIQRSTAGGLDKWDLSSLLLRFFEYFGVLFVYRAYGISITEGQPVEFRQGGQFALLIDNPLRPGRNVGTSTYAIESIQMAFARGLEYLTAARESEDVSRGKVSGRSVLEGLFEVGDRFGLSLTGSGMPGAAPASDFGFAGGIAPIPNVEPQVNPLLLAGSVHPLPPPLPVLSPLGQPEELSQLHPPLGDSADSVETSFPLPLNHPSSVSPVLPGVIGPVQILSSTEAVGPEMALLQAKEQL